ncbi:MAG: fused MFS/spermidine synthase [Myxococcales bacterium]
MRYAEPVLIPSDWLLLPLAIASLCSGAAALTLEVVWSKALVVPLGNSSDATAMVLSGFMLGIAGGAHLGAKLTRRTAKPLLTYASLELLLGLFALAIPHAFAAVTQLSVPGAWAENPSVAFCLRLAASLLLITVPCLVMGATLPLLLAAPAGRPRPRLFVGVLYGINTLGAALAAALTGFYGVANWGVLGCSRRAAAFSWAAAGTALIVDWLVRRGTPLSVVRDEPLRNSRPQTTRAVASEALRSERNEQRLALLATFVSGFSLLAAEVFWARILTFAFGHDTYAFATLLVFVLSGLAMGGVCYGALSRLRPRVVAGWAMAFTALSLFVSFYAASALLIRFGRDPFALGDHFVAASALSVEVLRELAYTPVLLLLPCFLSGVAYPACIALLAGKSDGSMARATGRIGLTNGIGATLGSAAAALGLVSLLGIQGVISCVSLACACVAAWLLLGSVRSWTQRAVRAIPLAACIAIVLLAPKDLPQRMLLSVVGPRHQSLLHYEEARTATVSVIRNGIHGERQLLVNAVNEVTTRLVHDQSFKLLGQLGPLVHPEPKTAVMICLGAGLAAGSALTHPLERLDVVDLLGAVRHGAAHFAEENNHVLDDSRLRLHVNDGRQYLLTTPNRYDLAIVDSTHPKSVDSWILYTREFFQLLRSRLNPKGMVVQWLPLHGLNEREFISVVATFASVFPHMTLWASVGFETYGHVGYAKLVGQNDAEIMRFDVTRIGDRMARAKVQDDLHRYGMGQLIEVLDQFIAGPDRIRSWIAGSPTLSDDRPYLAYLTELSSGRAMTPDLLLAVREPILPYLEHVEALDANFRSDLERAYDAQGFIVSGRLEPALAMHPAGEKIRLYAEQTKTILPYYSSLAERYPRDPERLFEAGTQLGALGHPAAARPMLETGLRLRPRSVRLALNLGLLRLAEGDAKTAARTFSELILEHPRLAILHHNLAAALLAQGEPGAARRALLTAIALDPQSPGARLLLAECEIALQNWPRAKTLLEALLRDNPNFDAAAARLATVSAKLGDEERALELVTRAAALDPYRESYAVELGTRLAVRNPRSAVEVLTRAERLHPLSIAPRLAHGEIQLRAEQWQDASQTFLGVLEMQPTATAAALGLGRALLGMNSNRESRDAFCLAATLGAPAASVRSELARLGEKLENCAQRAIGR